MTMPARTKLAHPALRHGAYSALDLLPGDDRAEFDRLHRGLIDEYSPSGPLEHHYVAELARLTWRYEKISIFRVAKLARGPFICNERPEGSFCQTTPDLEEIQAAQCAAIVKDEEDEARLELGDLYELVAVGEVATVPYLEHELSLRERLGEMITKCIKQLMLVKGLKSISPVSDPEPVRRLRRRLPAPSE